MHKLFLLIILILIFGMGFFLARQTLTQIYLDIKSNNHEVNPTAVKEDGSCDEACQKLINEQVSKAVATISAPKKESAKSTAAPVSQTQFISLDGSYSTASTDWVDVPGTDVTFDINKNYSPNSVVAWQATLNVANSNGQAFARLYDATHGMAVAGSEISTINNADYQTVYSGKLNLWSGSINYRVQIKSLNSLLVSYSGGKIKINY